jgi:putative tryptophan/tyrosine transport system substrate-binding protein
MQSSRFEFVVNLRTAKALGITFPQSILIRADEVIDETAVVGLDHTHV